MKLRLLTILAMVLLVVGCGQTSHHKVSLKTLQRVCPPGHSAMGCAVKPLSQLSKNKLTAPHGALFADVSSYQGHPDWSAIAGWQRSHGWKLAAIFKMGEYTLDPDAAYNAHALRTLGFWRAGYWFVRNTGCVRESGQIVNAAKRFGVKVVVLDMEVPEAKGYAPCLSGPVKKAGLIPVIYTSLGAWPGGRSDGLPAWGAAYGPTKPCLLWTCNLLAWQFTDGTYGARTRIPSLGYGDVSVDYGITSLGATPAPIVAVACFGQQHSPFVCKSMWLSAAKASLAFYNKQSCPVLASRIRWFAHKLKKHPKVKRVRRHRALIASRRAYRQHSCGTFAQRVLYFERKAA